MFSKFSGLYVILFVFPLIDYIKANPKYDDTKTNFPESKWRRSYYQKENETLTNDAASSKERLQRLGFATGYGGLNQGYGATGLGSYNPIKFDVGGIVLGTLVTVGAILIIPKLIGIFSSGYGGYARSTDSETAGLTEFLTKIDDILGQNNIDSTSCMQRAVCTYVRSTEANVKLGSADQTDQIIHALSENSLVDYMLNGTAIKEAIENGKNLNGSDCDLVYGGCPLNSSKAMQILGKMIPQSA